MPERKSKSTWSGFKAALRKEFDENPKIVFIGIVSTIAVLIVGYAVISGSFSAKLEYDDFKAEITTQVKS